MPVIYKINARKLVQKDSFTLNMFQKPSVNTMLIGYWCVPWIVIRMLTWDLCEIVSCLFKWISKRVLIYYKEAVLVGYIWYTYTPTDIHCCYSFIQNLLYYVLAVNNFSKSSRVLVSYRQHCFIYVKHIFIYFYYLFYYVHVLYLFSRDVKISA